MTKERKFAPIDGAACAVVPSHTRSNARSIAVAPIFRSGRGGGAALLQCASHSEVATEVNAPSSVQFSLVW